MTSHHRSWRDWLFFNSSPPVAGPTAASYRNTARAEAGTYDNLAYTSLSPSPTTTFTMTTAAPTAAAAAASAAKTATTYTHVLTL